MVVVSRFVRAPFSATIGSIEEYFRAHPKINVSPNGMPSIEVEIQQSIVDDASDEARKHDALQLTWAAPSDLFPALEALLTVRPHAPGTMLRIEAHYTPPYGLGGQIFDFFIGRYVAAITLHRLLARLLSHVEKQHAGF